MPSTTKDRLRRRESPTPSMKIDGDLVTERMQTRLEWVRSNIESLWKDQDVKIRPDRYEVVMDGNWWKWNIVLALTPGILIAAYCELVAKPKMLEKRKYGMNDGLPQPSSSSFLEDLYDGLVNYLYGMKPVETKQIQPNVSAGTGSGSISPQDSNLQELQALKDRIRELEERILSQKPRPGIRDRHQMTSPPSRPSSDSTGTNGESAVPSAASWIIQTLSESIGHAQEAAMSVVFPQKQENEAGQSNHPERISAGDDAVAAGIHDDHSESPLGSLESEDSSSLGSSTGKEQTEHRIATDETESRRWWQLWK